MGESLYMTMQNFGVTALYTVNKEQFWTWHTDRGALTLLVVYINPLAVDR